MIKMKNKKKKEYMGSKCSRKFNCILSDLLQMHHIYIHIFNIIHVIQKYAVYLWCLNNERSSNLVPEYLSSALLYYEHDKYLT